VNSNPALFQRTRRALGKGTSIGVVLGLLASVMAVGFVAFAPPASAATRPFTARFGGANAAGGSATNGVYNGDITIAANTLLSCSWPQSTVTSSACYKNQTGLTTVAGLNDDQNNSAPMVFVDADGTGTKPAFGGGTITTFNSSSSEIALPAGSTVLYAGLYFGGRLTGTGVGITAPASAANKGTVQFRTPLNAYKPLTAVAGGTSPASQLDIDAGGTGQDFAGFIDVTTDLKAVETANGTANGSYWVANLNAATGAQAYGGWSLVVAYANAAASARQLTIFDGYQSVIGGNVVIPLTGFRTPPTGTVKTKLGYISYEGDAGVQGDFGTLGSFTTGTPPVNVIQDTLNPYGTAITTSDLQNGTITRPNTAGAPTHVSNKSPSFQNQYGFDADLVNADGKFPNATAPTDTFDLTVGTTAGGADISSPTC
jgi:large repetitive protein